MNSLKVLNEFKSLALILSATLIILLLFPFSFWSSNSTSFYIGILKPIMSLLVAGLIIYTAYWTYKNYNKAYMSWLLLSVGMSLYFVANLFYFIFEDLVGLITSPLFVDIIYLSSYPFLAVGIVLFLKKPYKIRFKELLDVLIVMISAFFIVWFLFIWPAVNPSQPDTLSQIISIFYIFLDLTLLFIVLLLLFNQNRKIHELAIVLLALGLFFQLMGDMVYAYYAVHPVLVYKWLLNVLYTTNLIFVSLAVISYLKNIDINIIQPLTSYSNLRTKHDLVSYLPLILVLFTYGLLLITTPDAALIWGVGIIIVLVLLRQIISLNEIKKAQRTLKKNKEYIKNSLAEKETLLKEIHHRVKNNLQIVSSLLDLQEEYTKDETTASVLKESRNRVLSMSLLHELLYQSKDISQINVYDYIQNLVSNLFDSYNITQVNPVIKVADISWNIETAVPCGLIISELVSNSLKYAYPHDAAGKLLVSLQPSGDELELTISDDGVGIPEEFDFENPGTSLGLRLVNSLVQQLDGTMELDRSQGTKFKIIFKELKYKTRI